MGVATPVTGRSGKKRQEKAVWAEKVHRPIDDANLDAIRRSSATGLPYGDAAWVKRLAKRLKLDLAIRPRGRPRKANPSPDGVAAK